MNEEAVNQTLLRLSQPVEMEEVRREMRGGENGQHGEEKKEEEPEAEGGVCPSSKRLLVKPEDELEPKRSCR